MKRWVFLVLLALCATSVFGGWVKLHKTIIHFGYGQDSVQLHITTANDTAEIIDITPDGIDSFLYHDSLLYNAALANWDTLSWVSHPTIRRVTVGATIDTTFIDSILFDLGTNASAIEFDVPQIAGFTRAAYIDSMVARINALATTTDTILAEDSVTYILLRSKIAQIDLEGDARWVISFGTDSASNNMSRGTSTLTTVAMVCDTMVALINADDSMAAHVTASDSATKYTIVSDDAGLDIHFIPTDTSQDTTYIVLNGTSRSASVDTVDLMRYLGGESFVPGAIYARFILEASATTSKGLGLADSGYLWLYTVLEAADGTDEFHLLDSAINNALPCTLRTAIGRDTTGGSVDPDTLFKEGLLLVYKISDTASDSNFVANYSIDIDLKALKEE